MSSEVPISDDVRRRLAGVRLLTLDIDGTLTDGSLHYDAEGRVMRTFNVRDGVGIQRLMAAGVEIAFVSAGRAGAIQHRAEHLGVQHVHTSVHDKLETIRDLARQLGLGLDAVGHVGDDINDLPVLQAVGAPITVADGVDAAKRVAIYVTTLRGGKGAVREVAELMIALREEGGQS